MDRNRSKELRKALYHQWDNLVCETFIPSDAFKLLLEATLEVHSYCEELEQRVVLLEKQLSSQGKSISELGTRTAGLQTCGSVGFDARLLPGSDDRYK